MKKSLLISQLLCTAILLSFAGINAIKREVVPTSGLSQFGYDIISEEGLAREWLDKNTTSEQRKMIASLKIENAIQSKAEHTFAFVAKNTHEWKMFNSFPKNVQQYYAAGPFNSIIFEDKQLYFSPKLSKFSGENLGMIKVKSFTRHTPSKEDITNFNAGPMMITSEEPTEIAPGKRINLLNQ